MPLRYGERNQGKNRGATFIDVVPLYTHNGKLFRQEFVDQGLEVVDAVLAFDGETSLIIRATG